MTKQRGLGKGLQEMGLTELLSSINKPTENNIVGKLLEVNTTELFPGVYQPRHQFDDDSLQELAQSIKSQGVIQPLIVRVAGQNKYEIIAGERRWRAAKIAGKNKVPVVIKEIQNEAAMAMGLIENMQREDLNAIDLAAGIERLIKEFSLTHQSIASVLGKSRATISNTLRLLQLEPDLQQLVKLGDIEMGHARALLSLDGDLRQDTAKKIMVKNMSVRATEAYIQSLQKETVVKQAITKSDFESNCEAVLSENLATKVKVKAGKIVLKYNNEDELQCLVEKLTSPTAIVS